MDENAALKLAELVTQGLESRLNSIDARLSNLETKADATLVQATKTNGRVTVLEYKVKSLGKSARHRISEKRYRLTTAVAVLALFAPAFEALHIFG